MKYVATFDSHSIYEEDIENSGGVVTYTPSVVYCKEEDEVHYNPERIDSILIYVCDLSGNTNESIKIYYNSNSTYDEIPITEGNKWYSYVMAEGKDFYGIKGSKAIEEVQIKAVFSKRLTKWE